MRCLPNVCYDAIRIFVERPEFMLLCQEIPGTEYNSTGTLLLLLPIRNLPNIDTITLLCLHVLRLLMLPQYLRYKSDNIRTTAVVSTVLVTQC